MRSIVSMEMNIDSVKGGCYRFDSNGRGPSNGLLLLLLSLSVDRRRLWPAILGSDEGAEDLLNRPGLRSGSSFSPVVRWKRLRARPSAGTISQCLHGACVVLLYGAGCRYKGNVPPLPADSESTPPP
jgi:hypothetical protein